MSILYFQGGEDNTAAEEFNNDFYTNLVSPDNGKTFFPPFGPGTTSYFPWRNSVFVVSDDDQTRAIDPTIFNSQQIINHTNFLAAGISFEQAVEEGLINPVMVYSYIPGTAQYARAIAANKKQVMDCIIKKIQAI